jgi:hypothetical protein
MTSEVDDLDFTLVSEQDTAPCENCGFHFPLTLLLTHSYTNEIKYILCHKCCECFTTGQVSEIPLSKYDECVSEGVANTASQTELLQCAVKQLQKSLDTLRDTVVQQEQYITQHEERAAALTHTLTHSHTHTHTRTHTHLHSHTHTHTHTHSLTHQVSIQIAATHSPPSFELPRKGRVGLRQVSV